MPITKLPKPFKNTRMKKESEDVNKGSVKQRFSFKEREPEMNDYISLVWEDGSDCECIYTGLDKTILPLPTHWYYVD